MVSALQHGYRNLCPRNLSRHPLIPTAAGRLLNRMSCDTNNGTQPPAPYLFALFRFFSRNLCTTLARLREANRNRLFPGLNHSSFASLTRVKLPTLFAV